MFSSGTEHAAPRAAVRVNIQVVDLLRTPYGRASRMNVGWVRQVGLKLRCEDEPRRNLSIGCRCN